MVDIDRLLGVSLRSLVFGQEKVEARPSATSDSWLSSEAVSCCPWLCSLSPKLKVRTLPIFVLFNSFRTLIRSS